MFALTTLSLALASFYQKGHLPACWITRRHSKFLFAKLNSPVGRITERQPSFPALSEDGMSKTSFPGWSDYGMSSIIPRFIGLRNIKASFPVLSDYGKSE